MCVCGVSRVLLRKYLRNSICRFSRAEYSQAPGNENPSAKFTLLSHRAVLSLKGKDTTNFLQGIVTNDITLLPEMKCMYAMLLNQHGRVINDVMLYHQNSDESDEILMEGEKESIGSLIKTLKLYKLRKKVTITARDDVAVIQAMAPTPQFDLRIPFGEILATGVDPRSPILGHRVLINGSVEDSTDVDQDTSDYHYKRMYNGIPEGGLDLPPGNCLPLESNLDFMNGVSFHKGCYIGQELTARTRYTGVIRKRLLPVTIKSKGDIKPGEAISTEKGRGAGKFRSLHPNGEIGLALVRLNYAEGKLKTKTGGVELECHIPPWWPSKDGTEFSDGVCGPNIEGSI